MRLLPLSGAGLGVLDSHHELSHRSATGCLSMPAVHSLSWQSHFCSDESCNPSIACPDAVHGRCKEVLRGCAPAGVLFWQFPFIQGQDDENSVLPSSTTWSKIVLPAAGNAISYMQQASPVPGCTKGESCSPPKPGQLL